MRLKEKRKDKEFFFDSLTDYFEYIQPLDKEGNLRLPKGHKRLDVSVIERFYGCHPSKIRDRMYSWKEAEDEISALPEINPKGSGHWRRAFSDYDGNEVNIDRMYNEFPFLETRKRASGGYAKGLIDIVVNSGASGSVEASKMITKAYIVCRLCDQLESLGNKVRITCLFITKNVCYTYSNITKERIVVKDFNDPLSIGMLATVFSPWFLRAFEFLFCERVYGEDINLNYGQAVEEEEKKEEGVIYVPINMHSIQHGIDFIKKTMDEKFMEKEEREMG